MCNHIIILRRNKRNLHHNSHNNTHIANTHICNVCNYSRNRNRTHNLKSRQETILFNLNRITVKKKKTQFVLIINCTLHLVVLCLDYLFTVALTARLIILFLLQKEGVVVVQGGGTGVCWMMNFHHHNYWSVKRQIDHKCEIKQIWFGQWMFVSDVIWCCVVLGVGRRDRQTRESKDTMAGNSSNAYINT